ncbi:hypothetical protein C2S52_021295 [Perilla frutescens var. hirtella]|nr:hypothetical protein C2S52_021295 [Perilla frutescens var. hirtella]
MRVAYEKKVDDMPSFSIGLTQEDDILKKVMDVTRDIQESEQAPDETEGDKVTEEMQVDADVDVPHTRAGKNNTIVNPAIAWNVKKRMIEFVDRAMNEIKAFTWFNLQDIEMLFFFIYKENHFFLICIDVKDMEVVIIDNSTSMEKNPNDIKMKYGDIPPLLIKYFIELMKIKLAWLRDRSR